MAENDAQPSNINAKFMDYPLKKGVYYGTTYVDFPSREQVLKIVETNFE